MGGDMKEKYSAQTFTLLLHLKVKCEGWCFIKREYIQLIVCVTLDCNLL